MKETPHEKIFLNEDCIFYLMNEICYQIFKPVLGTLSLKTGRTTFALFFGKDRK